MSLEEAAAWELVTSSTANRIGATALKCVTSYNGSVNGIKYTLRYYQFKVGHGAVRTFMAIIGVIEKPQCYCFFVC